MFRTLALVLFVLIFVSLAGCAKKPTAPAAEPPVQAAPPESSNQVPAAPAATEQPAVATVTAPDGSQLETVHFLYDSSVLQDSARDALQRNAEWLKTNPEASVTIEGHCDERGSEEYNLALGEQRAQAVKSYLVNLGIVEARLNTISYGEEAPLDPGHDETAWEKNRRAAFK